MVPPLGFQPSRFDMCLTELVTVFPLLTPTWFKSRRSITVSLLVATRTKPVEISPRCQDLVKDINPANARYRIIRITAI